MIALRLVIAVHFAYCAAVAIALALVLDREPWYISLLAVTGTIRATFHNHCPLTILENSIRRHLNLPTYNCGFLTYYFGDE